MMLTLPLCVTLGDERAWAVLSPCRTYRYLLGRTLTRNLFDAEMLPVLVVGMINPSKADHEKSDPTITKLLGFANRLKVGSLIVCNLTAFRATNPRDLIHVYDPTYVRTRNLQAIELAFRGPGLAYRVAAWGRAPSKRVQIRLNEARGWMRQCGAAWCWGKTADGEPRHPLMLAYSTPLVSIVDGKPHP